MTSDLLPSSWQTLWRTLGARGDGAGIYEQLLTAYAQPDRHYHSLQHLGECLEHFNHVRRLAQHPGEVEAGLWFHDAIYELQAHDNEAQSAAWASRALLEAGVSMEVAARVQALVMATQHKALPQLPDEKLLVDIDLSILGTSDARFAQYEQQIRLEYAFVPEAVFHTKRRAVLQSFLERPQIFSTAHFRALLEERARGNLSRAIQGTKPSADS